MIDIQALQYFQSRMNPIDYTIIILGVVVLVMQGVIRWNNNGRAFFRRAEGELLAVRRTELQMQIVASLIELLPYLGILGTVWGLMNGLYVIQSQADPTIKAIAAQLAPALSSTFFGLIFAIINNLIFGFLAAYLEELAAAFNLYYEKLSTPTAELSAPMSETRRHGAKA